MEVNLRDLVAVLMEDYHLMSINHKGMWLQMAIYMEQSALKLQMVVLLNLRLRTLNNSMTTPIMENIGSKSSMTDKQIKFLKELEIIQEQAVNMNISQTNLTKEESLYNVSYDTLVLMMELLDGYRNMVLELSDKDSKEILNKDIQLHDGVVDFLKSF